MCLLNILDRVREKKLDYCPLCDHPVKILRDKWGLQLIECVHCGLRTKHYTSAKVIIKYWQKIARLVREGNIVYANLIRGESHLTYKDVKHSIELKMPKKIKTMPVHEDKAERKE